MGGFLTSRQCSMCTENLKDHSFWDLFRTWVRKYFWLIPVIVIVFTLLIIYCSRASPELDCKCPKDQAKLLHNISQLEVENLRKQLAKMEKQMQKLKSIMDQTEKKNLQLLEKKQEETDALSKELSVSNQSLVLTRQLLEKEKEKVQSLEIQLENAQEELRDSCQKQLNTLEEKLKSSDSKAEEYKAKTAQLQLQIKQEQRNQDSFIKEREAYQRRIGELNNEIAWPRQKESSTQNILDYGPIVVWAFVILGLLFCCV